MADNTLQFDWITALVGGLRALYRGRPDVFVAGDHLIYPVQGNNRVRTAPDAYVAFGRPPGYRGSYKVWEEGDIFPQVVFEVWSPGNRHGDAVQKQNFYERFGAQEYYLLDPREPCEVEVWLRRGNDLERVREANGFVSPLTGVRFEFDENRIRVFGPDGREFVTTEEVAHQRDEAEQQRDEIARKRDAAERERDEATRRAAALAAKLRALGVDPDAP